MAFDPDFAGDTHSASSERRERRRQEDKKRMAYRRAIEDYRESQALQEHSQAARHRSRLVEKAAFQRRAQAGGCRV